ncbi:MAG: T9SS type A sorting domain-containing protein, partial [Candidatus Delongbacteria bacterium]|nr:T9SS type A sorting domain-containing protein [Candidatus Delongbacteria bacterium]
DTPNYTSTIRSFVADIDGNGLKDIVVLNSGQDNDVTILFQTKEGDFMQEPQSGIENQDNLVSKTELYQNYPNPFNNETKIQFGLDASSEVELSVYNGKGELVESLIQGRFGKGIHSVNYRTDGLTSGVYYYELKVNGISVKVRKMLYLR